MIAIKTLACLALALLMFQPVAASNDCCPWTSSCKCPNGTVIFKKPWKCVNNTLTNSQTSVSLPIPAAFNYTELKISCDTTTYSKVVGIAIPAILFVVIVVCWLVLFIQSIIWNCRNKRNAEGSQTDQNNNNQARRQNEPINEDFSGFPVSIYY